MNTLTPRQKLNLLMEELGYIGYVKNKTNDEIVEMLEESFVPLSEIDLSQPYELIEYELRDIFWQKHWVPLSTFVDEAQAEKMYRLLCEFKEIVAIKIDV
jgi:hypothetical protein